MLKGKGSGVCLITLIGLVLVSFVQYGSAQQGFVSCTGFVEPSAELKAFVQKADYSFIKVHLVTKTIGIIKETAECAPNGFFMIPVYDSGDFELQVEGPEGWTFLPKKVPVTIEEGVCNGGKVVFHFTGFSIFGNIQSVGCGDNGVTSVSVDLLESSGKQISSTTSLSDGSYSFSNVKPGDYTLKVSKPSLQFNNDIIRTKIEWGNTQVDEVVYITGYTVFGKVQSVEDEPIANVEFDLYNSANLESSLAHTTSDNQGNYKFEGVPCGSYELIPTYRGEGTVYDVSPSRSLFTISGSSLTLSEFRVVGFSVRGLVLDRTQSGIPDVSVKVNGIHNTFTRADGSYTLEKLTTGDYNLEFEKQYYTFPVLSNLHITPRASSIEPVTVSTFAVCGKIEIASSPEFSKIREVSIQGDLSKSTKSSDSNEFCFQVPPGSYTIRPEISAAEREASLMFQPETRTVRVENAPVFDQNFSQTKVQLKGQVQCLQSPCSNVQVELRQGNKPAVVAQVQNNQFEFPVVYPGKYQLSVQPDFWCWQQASQPIQVGQENILDLLFVQTGFQLMVESGQAMHVKAVHQQTNEQVLDLDLTGAKAVCLPRPGSYVVSQSSCFKTQQDSWEISTESLSAQTKVRFVPSHVRVEGSIKLENLGAHSVPDQIELSVESTSGSSSTIAKRGSDPLEFHYEIWRAPGETVQLSPGAFGEVLFYPASQKINLGSSFSCVAPVAGFVGRPGKFIRGHIEPQLENVEISVRIKSSGELVLKTRSDEDGEFSVGPLYDDLEYSAQAYFEGYHFSQRGSDFVAVELRHFSVLVRDANERGIAGVILTLTGSDAFYNVSVTDETGRCSFGELFPGSYFLRAALKEYVFEPSSLNVEIVQGGSQQEKFLAKRVAYSCFGSVRSLNGEAERGVSIVAKSLDDKELEETQTDENGSYRIRGLKPNLDYSISVRSAAKIESASPLAVVRTVGQDDIRDVNFVAFRAVHKYDIYGRVDVAPEFLSTLTVELYVNNKKQQKEELVKSIQIGPSNYWEFPMLKLEDYVVKLKSSLNPNQYEFDLPEVVVNLEELISEKEVVHNRYYVPLKFDAQLHFVPTEIGNVSFYPLLILSAIFLGFWYRTALSKYWAPKPVQSKGWGSTFIAAPPKKSRK